MSEDQRIEDRFAQLAPQGPVLTFFQCLECGATVTVVPMVDGRLQHLRWHDAHRDHIEKSSAALDAIGELLEGHRVILEALADRAGLERA